MLCVWVEEGDGAVRERRQRPREIELAEAEPSNWMHGDQRERVRPDAEPRTGDVATPAESRLAAEEVMAGVGPHGRAPPAGAVEDGREDQQHPRAARQATIEDAPAGKSQHADRTGARCAQHDHVDEEDDQRRSSNAEPGHRFRKPDRSDDRPQQQAAEVIGLAQVAGRSPRNRREGDPIAIGKSRREDLDEPDHAAGDARNDQGDTERTKRRLCQTALARLAATATTSNALRMVPASVSDSDHGRIATAALPMAAMTRMASAPMSARLARLCGQSPLGSSVTSSSRKPPQPTKAAA